MSADDILDAAAAYAFAKRIRAERIAFARQRPDSADEGTIEDDTAAIDAARSRFADALAAFVDHRIEMLTGAC